MTETAKRGPPTRGYITDFTTLTGELRTKDAPTQTFSLDGMPTERKDRLAMEAVFLLSAQGRSILGVLDGAAIPDRTPPVVKGAAAPRPEGIGAQAAISVYADELYAIAKFRTTGRLSPPEIKAMRGAAEAESRAWWNGLSSILRAKAKRNPKVLVRVDEMKGRSGMLGDLMEIAEAKMPAPDHGDLTPEDDAADDADHGDLDEEELPAAAE